MTTASTQHTTMSRVRAFALAITLAFTSILPVGQGNVFADGEQVRPTATATSVKPYVVDTSNGLEGLTAVADGQNGTATLFDAAKANAKVLGKYNNGTIVDLRIDQVDTIKIADGTQFWPVSVGGTDGWISGYELSDQDDVQFGAPAPSRAPYDFTGNMQAEVSADGQGLVMRAEPSDTSAKVVSLSDGSIVNLRIDELDTVYDGAGVRWWPVEFESNIGWVNGYYLIEPGTVPMPAGSTPGATTTAAVGSTPGAVATTNPSEPRPTATAAPNSAFAVNDWAMVSTDDESAVDLKTTPSESAKANGSAPFQALVRVLEVPGNGWVRVRWDKTEGWVQESVLTKTQGPSTTPNDGSRKTSQQPITLTKGAAANVDSESTSGVNVRQDAAMSSAKIGQLADGAQVTILDGPKLESGTGISWYQIESNGVTGWVDGALLNPTTEKPQGTVTPQASSSQFIIPVAKFAFTQDFGCSELGFYAYDPAWGCAVHDGVDLAADAGTPLLAAGNGNVVAAGWCDCGLGYYVEIDHGGGIHTVYGHMQSQPSVTVGQQVTQGQSIGPMGSTGLSTGPHVHFMVRKDGVSQDPKAYLPPLR